MSIERTCCATGHRNIPAKDVEYVKQELRCEVLEAIDDGYDTFISGFAEGADLLFAESVLEVKKDYPHILLEGAFPFPGSIRKLDDQGRELLRCCFGYKIVCDRYSGSCYMKRNQYMIERSSRVIAVYDGREKGGTLQTMRFAHINKIPVRIISIKG